MREKNIECQICHQKFVTITNTHLKKHNITSKDYKKQFPGHSLGNCSWFDDWRQGDENKEHMRQQARKMLEDPVIQEKRKATLKITMQTQEYRDKLSQALKDYSQTDLGKLHHKFGNEEGNRQVTPRMRMSNYDRWVEEFGEDIARQKQLDWQEKNKLPSSCRDTKIERVVANAFRDAGYEVVTQHCVPKYYCDVYVPGLNLVIEVNGNYWHANPNWFKPDDVVWHKRMTASQVWERDAQKERDIRAMGFDFVTVWEDETVKFFPAELVNEVLKRRTQAAA